MNSYLLEYVDIEKTVATLGDKLIMRFSRDQTIADETNPATFITNVRDNIDPTDNHQYTLWILRTYIKGGIRLAEDMSRVHEALVRFHTNKRAMDVKDINRFKKLSDLVVMVNNAATAEPSGKELKRQEREEIYNETEVFYKGPEGMIVIPKTREASCYWGKGTQWCTASTTSDNYFDSYNRQGNLYIVMPKDGTKWQLHVESGTFLDAQDEEFDLEEWSDTYPWAHELLAPIYPRLNPLWKLQSQLPPQDFIAEVKNRAESAPIPSIDHIEGDTVVLDMWRSLEEWLRESGMDRYIDIDVDELDSEEDYVNDDTVIKTIPSFDRLLLSRMGSVTRSAVASYFPSAHTDEAIVAAVLEESEWMKPIYKVITKNFNGDRKLPSEEELIIALVEIASRMMVEHNAVTEYKDGWIRCVMDLHSFVTSLDSIDTVYQDEVFITGLESDQWGEVNEENATFDDLVHATNDSYGMWVDDDLLNAGKIIRHFQSGGIPDTVYISDIKDHQTPDMFGNTEKSEAVEIPVDVIDQVVEHIKKSLRIMESRKSGILQALLCG